MSIMARPQNNKLIKHKIFSKRRVSYSRRRRTQRMLAAKKNKGNLSVQELIIMGEMSNKMDISPVLSNMLLNITKTENDEL